MVNDYYPLISKLLSLIQYRPPGLLGSLFGGYSVSDVHVHHVNKMAQAFYEGDWREIIWIGAGENYPKRNWPTSLSFRYCLLYGYAHFRDADFRDNRDSGYHLSMAASMASELGISPQDIQTLHTLVDEARKR